MEIQLNSQMIGDVLSFISKRITDWVTGILLRMGIEATTRFSSLVTIFLGVSILYFGIKLVQPVLKIILIILAALIFIGIFVPSW